MSKRSHTLLQSTIDADDQPFQKSRPSGLKRLPSADDMGEFEDAWEDEIEDEEFAQNPTNDPNGPFLPLLTSKERLIVISQLPSSNASR